MALRRQSQSGSSAVACFVRAELRWQALCWPGLPTTAIASTRNPSRNFRLRSCAHSRIPEYHAPHSFSRDSLQRKVLPSRAYIERARRIGLPVQVQTRGALPAQSVILLGAERDAYFAAEPADDARFVTFFAHALEHTGGYPPPEAERVARTLLPDLLSYDPTRPASFPDNGRTLADDAFDSFLRILTNGKVTEDKVGSHDDLVAEFPYLGPPHKAV